MPVVFIATQGRQYEKVLSNIEEVRSRGGRILAVATEGDTQITELAEHVFYIPDVPEPSSRFWPCCRCSFWPITPPSCAGATWTSRGTSPKA